MTSTLNRFMSYGVAPVIVIDDARDALPLADALLEGGLPVAEITFRTAAAAEAIEQIAAARPDVLIGAGTVLTAAQLEIAKNAGACFGLSPGLDPALVQAAQHLGFDFVPGVMTPSDLITGVSLDVRFFKFFPAGAAGGLQMLSSIAAPFAHLGLGFNPTGGVNIGNLPDWLSNNFVKVVGGTWIATRTDIAEGKWSRIANNAREAVQSTAIVRSAK